MSSEAIVTALGWTIAAVAFFSFLAVQSWAENRAKERETYYRSEAIKKLAEMQGSASEPVLSLLREALREPVRPSPWVAASQYKIFYKSEIMKRLAEQKGEGANALLALLREEELRAGIRVRGGLQLAGLILAALGIGLLIFLHAIVPDMPVYLIGFIPLFVSAALLIFAFAFMRPNG